MYEQDTENVIKINSDCSKFINVEEIEGIILMNNVKQAWILLPSEITDITYRYIDIYIDTYRQREI